jgi:hypothetical protein
MHPQLQALADEFEAARDRLHDLRRSIPDLDRWTLRRDPARWSMAECLAHLNLTSLAYGPIVRDGLAEAKRLGRPAPKRLRRDLPGWLLWKTMGPPVRFRVKTTAAFVPSGADPPEKLVADFERLQNEQLEYVRSADGLAIGEVKVASPFNPRLRYNLYSCLSILPRHQHRHLWQAEQVWGA